MTTTKLYSFPHAPALARRRMAPVRLVALLALLLSAPIAAGAQDRAGLPSPSAALGWSLVGTLVPVTVGASMLSGDGAGFLSMALGLTFGPALGYWYSGQNGRGWLGVGLRLAADGAFIAGVAMAFSDSDSAAGGATTLALAGGGLAVASAVMDIALVRGSVKRRNAWAGWAVSVAPLVRPAAHAGGLVVSVRF